MLPDEVRDGFVRGVPVEKILDDVVNEKGEMAGSYTLGEWLSTTATTDEAFRLAQDIYFTKPRYRANTGRARVKALWKDMDNAVEQDTASLESHKDDDEYLPIACGKNCSACCYMKVDVFIEEGIYYANKIRRGKLDYNKEEYTYQLEKGMSITEDFEKNPRPCIFLKEGSCSIYEERPASCRKHFVVGTPEKCDLKKYPNGTVLKPLMYTAEVQYGAMSQVSSDYSMPMVRVIDAALRGEFK